MIDFINISFFLKKKNRKKKNIKEIIIKKIYGNYFKIIAS